jgi:hypothetical protein
VGKQLASLNSKKGKTLQEGERSNEEKSVQVVQAVREPPPFISAVRISLTKI